MTIANLVPQSYRRGLGDNRRPAPFLPSAPAFRPPTARCLCPLSLPTPSTSPAAAPLPSILHEVFGYAQFRGPQQAIVDHVVGGGDALVLMPTGGGKSLCYQIPAIARQRAGHGVAIVVSPLIALMHDQVGALHEAGVDAAFLNSTLDWEQTQDVERRMLRGEITLLYAAPERVEHAALPVAARLAEGARQAERCSPSTRRIA